MTTITDYTPTLVLVIPHSGGSSPSIGMLLGRYEGCPSHVRVYSTREELTLRTEDYLDLIREDNADANRGKARPRYVGTIHVPARVLKISEEEGEALRRRSRDRIRHIQRREIEREIEYLRARIDAAPEDLPSDEEAARRSRKWAEIHNEGGEGFVPDFVSAERHAGWCRRLSELEDHLADL